MVFKALMLGLLFVNGITIGHCGEFSGDKVLRIFPENLQQLNILINIEQTDSQKYDFWQFPGEIGKPVDIHVKLLDFSHFTAFLDTNNIKYHVLMHNLQAIMDHQNDEPSHTSDKALSWYEKYHPFEEVVKKISELVKNNAGPAGAELFSIGQTIEGRELFTVKITGPSTPNKPVIFINCGIHAREWVGPPTCIYMIDELINKYGKEPNITSTLNKIDFIILPVLNADGYVFSWKPGKRLWRKNRRPPTDARGCYGVDLNRNFPYNWDKIVSKGAVSLFPCSDIYGGKSAASEKEVQNVVNYLRNLKSTENLKAYMDIHSYSQMWMLPWGYTTQPPPDYKELLRVANIAKVGIQKHSGTEFEVGSSSRLLYATTGTTKDFVYGELKVPYTYVLELRDKGRYGFVLPASGILPTARETFGGIQAMVDAMDLSYVSRL